LTSPFQLKHSLLLPASPSVNEQDERLYREFKMRLLAGKGLFHPGEYFRRDVRGDGDMWKIGKTRFGCTRYQTCKRFRYYIMNVHNGRRITYSQIRNPFRQFKILDTVENDSEGCQSPYS